MASVELAVIGAGSAQFSLGVVRDLAAIPGLWGSHGPSMSESANQSATGAGGDSAIAARLRCRPPAGNGRHGTNLKTGTRTGGWS